MQKIKNPILCWLVIFAVFLRPTPAQAGIPLAVVAVGAVIAATGVMVAGAGVYKPPTFAQANAAVDQVTGDITRKVIVARAFAQGVSGGIRGFESQYVLDFSKVSPWVREHPTEYPTLSPAVLAAWAEQNSPSPQVGNVMDGGSLGKIKVATLGSATNVGTYRNPATTPIDKVIQNLCNGTTVFYLGGGRALTKAVTPNRILFGAFDDTLPPSGGWPHVTYYQANITYTITTDPVYPVPTGTTKPERFAPAFPNTEPAHDELDHLVNQTPSAVKSKPQEMTLDQIEEATKQIEKELAQAEAQTARTLADANPGDSVLEAAAAQAEAKAKEKELEAESEKAKLETKDDSKVDTPPGSLSPPEPHVALDFTPLYALSGQASGHYPFNILSSASSYFSCLVAEPQPPSFTMPTVFGRICSFDLSAWSTSASVMRGAMLFFFNIACMVAIVRRWS